MLLLHYLLEKIKGIILKNNDLQLIINKTI